METNKQKVHKFVDHIYIYYSTAPSCFGHLRSGIPQVGRNGLKM